MKSLATKSVMEEFTPEEIRRMYEENVAECRSKHFAYHTDVVVVFAEHGKEWGGVVLYDQDGNECFLLCAREELVPLLDRYRPKWREEFCNPDDFQRN
jgi:helix-turn-helix protein